MRVINCFTDPRLGGPGRRSIDVGTELRKRGFDVHFLIPEGDESLSKAAVNSGFRVHRLSIPRIRSPSEFDSNLRFLLTFRLTTRSIQKLLDSLAPDIVHVNTPYNFQTARAAFLTDSALVWHFNDTLTPWPVNRLAGWTATRWADEIVLSADAVKEHFFAQEVETRTLYPPVDLDEFDPETHSDAPETLREELEIGDAGPVIGTIGNVNPAKGHQYLIEAVPDVIEQFPDAQFLFVGSKLISQRRYFDGLQKTISRLDIEENVQFTGWRSDIPELLSLFDLFVLPSTTEACPIVVLESMAMYCPIVATEVGGVTEQLPSEEYAWVVPPGDSTSLAEAVVQALNSASSRQNRAKNARNRVEEIFSLEAIADAHSSLYQNL